jgi:AcrR family transcriptional regulator
MSREARREAFLDVAAELVQAGGVAAVSFESVATAAGVAKTLPYAYFDGVEDILVTLFERVIGGVDAAVDAVLSTDSLAFGEIVASALGVWFDAVANHGRLVAALLDGRAHPGLAAAITRRDRASHKRWHDLMAERLGLDDPDAHLLAAMLTSTATATVGLWVGRRGSRAALVAGLVAMAEGAAAALVSRR